MSWAVVAVLTLAALALGGEVAIAHNASCWGEDKASGWGGNEVSCRGLSCQKGATLSVYVDAYDRDATAYGSAGCGGLGVNCSNEDSCSNSRGTTSYHQDGGSCSGGTNENYNSGVYIRCEAYGGGLPPDPNPPPTPCPPFCGSGGGGCNNCREVRATAGAGPLVPPEPAGGWTASAGTSTPGAVLSAIHLFVGNGRAIAFACDVGSCVEIVPMCATLASGWTCRVGMTEAAPAT